MIPERLYHVCDAVAAAVMTVVPAVVAVIVSQPYDPEAQLAQTLLPLIGAVLMGAGVIMLNPGVETRRIVLGRSFIAGFFGVISPSLAIAILPNVLPEWALWAVEVMKWPMALVGMGGIISGVFYILSRPFFARAYERADAIAQAQVDRLQKLAQGPNNTVMVISPEVIGKASDKLKP
jgi:hypothetical protein